MLGDAPLFGGGRPGDGSCVDQQAALFAEGCRTPGEAKCTYGTGAFLLACTGDRPTRSSHGLVGCLAWRLGGELTWCLDGQVYTVGAAVTWLIEMGMMDGAGRARRASAAAVARRRRRHFVPALAGLGCAVLEAARQGAFTGMSLGTERAHLVRACIDGIAAQVALLAHAVDRDLGAPLTRLACRRRAHPLHACCCRRRPICVQCPVEVYPSPHATALGVAALASLGAGLDDGAPPTGRRPPSSSRDLRRPKPPSGSAAWQAAVGATLAL